MIGNDLPGGPEYFNGVIDEVAIYNRALRDSEIHVLSTNVCSYPTQLFYRSKQTGNWNDVNTWESSAVEDFSSGVLSPALTIPTAENSYSVIIRKGDVVTATVNGESRRITVNNELRISTGINFLVVP